MNAFVVFGASSMLRKVMWAFAIYTAFALPLALIVEGFANVLDADVAVVGPNTKTYLTGVMIFGCYHLVRAAIAVFRPPLDEWWAWPFLRAAFACANALSALYLAGL